MSLESTKKAEKDIEFSQMLMRKIYTDSKILIKDFLHIFISSLRAEATLHKISNRMPNLLVDLLSQEISKMIWMMIL